MSAIRKVFGNFVQGRGAVGLLILRVVVGLALAHHGFPKIQNAFGWMGPQATMPGILQALAALSEFGGGVGLIVGLLTPLAAFGIACTMTVAITTVHMAKGDPFVGKPGQGSYELAAAYLSATILLMLIGPGALSLDALIFGRAGQERV